MRLSDICGAYMYDDIYNEIEVRRTKMLQTRGYHRVNSERYHNRMYHLYHMIPATHTRVAIIIYLIYSRYLIQLQNIHYSLVS